MEPTENIESMKETRSMDLAELAGFQKAAGASDDGTAGRPLPAIPLFQYPCFDRSFKFELAMLTLFVPVLATLWIFAGYYYYFSGRLSLPITRIAAYCTVAFVFAHVFYHNARALARAGAVIVGGGRVSKKYADAVSVFNLGELTDVRRSKIPLVRRMILMSRQKKFAVPLSVHGGSEMIEKIFGVIEARGILLKNLSAVKSKFYAAAKCVGVRYGIRADNRAGLIRAVVAVALLNCAVVTLFQERSLFVALVLAFLNMHLQTAAYLIAESFHVKKILRGGDNGGSDDGNDGSGNSGGAGTDNAFSGYYIIAGLIAMFAGMAIGILYPVEMHFRHMNM